MNHILAQDDVEFISSASHWLKTALTDSQPNSHQTAHQIANQITVQLPAGSTPKSLYHYWESTRPDYLQKVHFQQLDDVLTGPKKDHFKLFFQQHLPSYVNQFIPLANSPITPGIAILGVGLNGHLAFHEPEINFNFNYGCVKLSTSTCKNLGLAEPTWGLSYGVAHFMQCQAVLILAKGENKKAIVQKALQESTASSPLSYVLKSHANCTLLQL